MLHPSDQRQIFLQGASVALSVDGNTAIVGGPNDNDFTGAAWVYTRSGTSWTQQGLKLVGRHRCGWGWKLFRPRRLRRAVCRRQHRHRGGPGHHLPTVVGTGAAWVYTRSGTSWTQQGSKLVGTGGIGSFVQQGYSVALSADGNTAIVGGDADKSGAGAARLEAPPKASPSGCPGNTAIVGGPSDSSGTGAAWVYTRSNGDWSQQRPKLVGTGAVGSAAKASPSGCPPTATPPSWAGTRTTPAPGPRGSLSRGRCKSRLRPTSRSRASKGRSSRPRRSLIS